MTKTPKKNLEAFFEEGNFVRVHRMMNASDKFIAAIVNPKIFFDKVAVHEANSKSAFVVLNLSVFFFSLLWLIVFFISIMPGFKFGFITAIIGILAFILMIALSTLISGCVHVLAYLQGLVAHMFFKALGGKSFLSRSIKCVTYSYPIVLAYLSLWGLFILFLGSGIVMLGETWTLIIEVIILTIMHLHWLVVFSSGGATLQRIVRWKAVLAGFGVIIFNFLLVLIFNGVAAAVSILI